MEVETNSFGPIDVAISGLRAQRRNITLISGNVANSQTTRTGNGQPYQRLEAVFQASDEPLGGVEITEVVPDTSAFPKVYKPGHPDADPDGYVKMPNVSLPMEMMNLSLATRAYQANAATLKRYQRMVETALDLLR